MEKYRKKPIIVEAKQWSPIVEGMDVPEVVYPFRMDSFYYNDSTVCEECGCIMSDHGWIGTREGGHRVCHGDWIIKGIEDEFYPCKPSIFEATYEPVD